MRDIEGTPDRLERSLHDLGLRVQRRPLPELPNDVKPVSHFPLGALTVAQRAAAARLLNHLPRVPRHGRRCYRGDSFRQSNAGERCADRSTSILDHRLERQLLPQLRRPSRSSGPPIHRPPLLEARRRPDTGYNRAPRIYGFPTALAAVCRVLERSRAPVLRPGARFALDPKSPVSSLPIPAKTSAGGEIIPCDVRHSGITSHSIGIPELGRLLGAVPADADPADYRRAIVELNVLGLATETGRIWRYKTLRRLYLLRPNSPLFRALRDLWPHDAEARPLLAALCALATDTVFRASAALVVETTPGDEVTAAAFAERIETHFPGVYAHSTLEKAASNAYASWQQAGHLSDASEGSKTRRSANCRAADVAYALLLGHLSGHRGEALFETLWARILDQPRSRLYDLATTASRSGMLEFRYAGGVVEVGFRELLRPLEGELF